MRAVIQRVSYCQVKVNEKTIGQIGQGLLVFLAIKENDNEAVIDKLAKKIINLRIFDDGQNRMNLSVKEIAGEIIVVSQFTLYGDAGRGNRPSFIESAEREKAKIFYEKFINYLVNQKVKVQNGEFGAIMQVELINDGPVTIIIDL